MIPEFSTSFNHLKPELLSRIVLSVLSNLIVIIVTAELSILYSPIDNDDRLKEVKDVIDKMFQDIRVKHLFVAIVLDVITFYFVTRLPSWRQTLEFDNVIIILLFIVSIYTLISSFGAMVTLLTNEKIKRANILKNNE